MILISVQDLEKSFGIHEVLLPEGNVPDLSEIDPAVRAALNFTAVSHMDEVLDVALCREQSGEEKLLMTAESKNSEGAQIRQ